MALSTEKHIFGIHSITPYNPDTGVPYGTAHVLGEMSFELSAEQIELTGGSQRYPYSVEQGLISAAGSISMKEVPTWATEVFLGAANTDAAAETGGAITAITDLSGTSVVDSTGIASVSVKSGSEADVKTGMYIVKAVSATTVDVYCMTDVDFLRGTDLVFVNDALKITSSPLTITTGTAVDIPSVGLQLTGGAGTIGMTTGDTAFFDARSINTGSSVVTIGSRGQSIPNIGMYCVAQKGVRGEIFIIDIMRCVASGFPIKFTENAFSTAEISFKAFFDSARNGVFRYIYVNGT